MDYKMGLGDAIKKYFTKKTGGGGSTVNMLRLNKQLKNALASGDDAAAAKIQAQITALQQKAI
jgi:protein-arginine kinase activator protein McsA